MGAEGRRFKSGRPDQARKAVSTITVRGAETAQGGKGRYRTQFDVQSPLAGKPVCQEGIRGKRDTNTKSRRNIVWMFRPFKLLILVCDQVGRVLLRWRVEPQHVIMNIGSQTGAESLGRS